MASETRTYRDTVGPSVDGNGEADMASNGVAGDGGGALQGRRVIERPGVGANANTQVEQLLALDVVVGDTDTSVATAILVVDQVDGAEAHVVRRGDDGVACDGASWRTKNDNTAVGRAIDL